MNTQKLKAARKHLKKGQVDDARRLLTSLESPEEDNVMVSHLLGICDFREKQFEKAEHHFRKAVSVDGLFADSRYYIGLCLERLGRHEEAEVEYRSVLAIDPHHSYALKKVGKNKPNTQEGTKNSKKNPSKSKPDPASKLTEDGLAKGIYTDQKSKFVYNTQIIFTFIFSFLFGGAIAGGIIYLIASSIIGNRGFVIGIIGGIIVGIAIGIVNAGSVKKFK